MLRHIVQGLRCSGVRVGVELNRSISVSSVLPQKAAAAQIDPIQQLFVDKIREYKKLSVGGKLVGMSPAKEQELNDKIQRLSETYGANKEDFTKFPEFTFQDPDIQNYELEAGSEGTDKSDDLPALVIEQEIPDDEGDFNEIPFFMKSKKK